MDISSMRMLLTLSAAITLILSFFIVDYYYIHYTGPQRFTTLQVYDMSVDESGQTVFVTKFDDTGVEGTSEIDNKSRENQLIGSALIAPYSYLIHNDSSLNYIIPNYYICAKNNPQLLLWVYSAVPNSERRNAIRKTWGQVDLFKPIRVVIVFSLAVTKDRVHQNKLLAEQTKYGDIVQDGSFIDAYRNLTYKAQSMLRWTSAFCSQVKILMKLDDDSFLIPSRMSKWLNHFQTANSWPKNSVIGTIWRSPRPNRGKSKWTVTRQEWPESIFAVKACPGSGYMITGDSVKRLKEMIPLVRFLWLEDMYTTGVLAQMAHLNYIDNSANHHLFYRPAATYNTLKVHKAKYLIGHLPTTTAVLKFWDAVRTL